jgi:hypothetical protein
MRQIYFRDLRRRVAAIEPLYCPKPDPIVTAYLLDDDGLPTWVCVIGQPEWLREPGKPIPPEILQYATPQARAAYEARLLTEPPEETSPGGQE